MTPAEQDWGTHQLSEFLASISTFQDEASALNGAIERVAEAFEAEIGMIRRADRVLAVIGMPVDHSDVGRILGASDRSHPVEETGLLGPCSIANAELEDGSATELLVARSGDSAFDREEQVLLNNMGRTLGLVVRMLRTLEGERAALARLEERQLLLERLSRIQRSISHRAPLQEVLDSVTEGLRQLTGDKVAGLRLADPDDPDFLILVSASGVETDLWEHVRRSPRTEGAGGIAYSEERLVVIHDYQQSSSAIDDFASAGLQSAMAAPVYEDGEVAGSLVSASYRPGRGYSSEEQEMLFALAEHASLALTDAKTVEAMREARRAKDMFLAMVSHELKTPLTVMMGTLHTIRAHGGALDESISGDLVKAALVRGTDLKHLIDMLLKGARGELAGVQRNVYLPDLVAGSVRGFDATKEVLVEPPPEIWIVVDPIAIHQIIGVLMENAVTHSADGAVVRVRSALSDGRVTIEVKNPGSLPNDLARDELFKPFQRGDDARSAGVGLGLYIADQLAESIGGRLEVTDDGTDVAFRLSLRYAGGKEPAGSELREEATP